MKSERKTFAFQIAGLMVTAAAAAFVSWYPVTDGDIFWHLAAGREMLHEGSFLRTDPFSFTTPGAPWLNLHWLFQLIAFTVESHTGYTGLQALQSLVFAGAGALLYLAVPGAAWLKAPLCISCLYELRYLVPLRPGTFTLLYLALFLLLLERFRRTAKVRYLYWLLPVQVAWVNTQGLFLLGPAVAFTCLFAEWACLFTRVKPFFAVSPAMNRKVLLRAVLPALLLLPAACCNPYGFLALQFPFELLGHLEPSLRNIYSVNITENAPLLSLLGTASSHYVYFLTMVTVIAVLCVALLPRCAPLSYVLVPLPFLGLAWMAQRNIPLYIFTLLPLLSQCISCIAEKLPRGVYYKEMNSPGIKVRWFNWTAPVLAGVHRWGRVLLGSALCILATVVLVEHGLMLSRYGGLSLSPFTHPSGSTAYLIGNPIAGNCFNADRYGGYLLWKLYPQKKVFIDTRLIIRTRAFFAGYLAMLDNPEMFDTVCDKFTITHAVLPTALTGRYARLAQWLYRSPRWKLVYADGAEALFCIDSVAGRRSLQLSDPVTIDSMLEALGRRYNNEIELEREARYHLGNFLSFMGACPSAERVLSGVQLPGARVVMAHNRHQCGDSEGAIDILRKLIKEKNAGSAARLALARVHLERHEFRTALENVIFVLRREPFNAHARALIREIHSQFN